MTTDQFSTKILITINLLFFIFFSQTSSAEEKPLWQLGAGVGSLSQSYYTGTRQRRNITFPVVLPIYRGEIFKSDDRGLRAELLKNEKLKLDVSFDFNFSIDSDEVDLREGLPDIANNLQVGPALEWSLYRSDDTAWTINFPLRANIGFEGSDVDIDGFTFSPNIEFTQNFHTGKVPWRFGASLGPQFGSSSFHDIYYGVDQEFATNSRPAFDADGGYTGYRAQTSLVTKNNRHLFVAFLRYENISGAVFEDSPLIETDDNLIVGFIYNYYFFNSKKRVDR